MGKLSVRCIVLLACLVLVGGTLQAQEVTATLVGQVTDSTGAFVSGAVLTVTNTDKNIVVRTVKSDAKGEFTATLLPIGNYSILVRHEGFRELHRTGVELHVGDRATLTLMLQPGSVSTTVNVDEAAPQVQLQSSDSEQLISGQTIRDLSISNRNFLALLTLLPGVSNTSATDEVPIGAVNPTGGVNALSFSLNGGRITTNSFLIDGADNMDRGANQTLVNTPSVDAIAEFKVVRGVYSAEYGRNASGQVNLVTRSGTSGFHGGAYEFFRNDILAANNALNNYKHIARPELRYNDFGWTLGGPVFIPNHYNTNRDKTFFFYSQELRRIITYTTTSGYLPSAAMEQGNFTTSVCTGYSSSNACTGMATSIPQSAWSPVAAAYIKDIFSKLPMGDAADAYQVVSTGRNTFDLSDLLARVDEVLTPREALTIRYMQDSGSTQEPYGYQVSAAVPQVSATATSHPGTNIMARLTSTLRPDLMNEIAFAFTSGRIHSVPVGLLSKANATDVKVDLPFQSTLGNVPYVSMTGLSRLSGYGPYDNHSRNYNVFDNVVSVRGRHTLKYGFTYNYYQKSEDNASTNAGSFSFTPATGGSQQSFANFLIGQQATFTQTSLDLTPDIRQNEAEFYVQDDFRWRPNLTINAGVRYSIFRVPTDARNMLTNFDPAKYVLANAPTLTSSGSAIVAGTGDPLNGIIVNGKTSPYGNAVSNEPGGHFAPRVGFSWDPTSKGQMAIRGGYGIVYDSTLVGIYENNIFTNPGFLQNANVTNTTFADPANGTVTNGVSTSLPPLRGTPLPARLPYTQMWSFDVQTQITPSTTLDTGYYGDKGTHLLGIADINTLPPGYYASLTGNTTPLTTSSTPKAVNPLRPYLGYLAINNVENWFGSNYNSLQVYLQQQLPNHSRLTAAYTWEKTLTDASTDRNNAPQNAYNIHTEYAPAAFSRKQFLVLSYIYREPYFAGRHGILADALKSWELAGTSSFESGLPTQVTSSSGKDPGQMGVLGSSSTVSLRPDIVGNPNQNAPHTLAQWFNTAAYADVPAGQVRPGNAPSTSLIGPGFQQWDISVFRDFQITERWSGQFRVETFNTFNHTNPATVNASGPTNENAAFGQVTAVRDPRRMQLAMKINF
jgi:hypothetical protein